MTIQAPDILIVGGTKDPSIGVLATAARRLDRAAVLLTFGDGTEPAITWSLADGAVALDGDPLVPRGAFLRQDVFSYKDSFAADRLDKSMAWHAAVTGACFSNADIRVLNRDMDWRTASKPIMLELARQQGLKVPETIVSNHQDEIVALHQQYPRIVKPVAGGAYCVELSDILDDPPWCSGVAPVPAIVQERLDYPEYRVYIVGDRLISFEVISEVIDYRTDRKSRITPLPPDFLPLSIQSGLLALAREVGIDFGAADFKTRTATDEICFLELNNQPMFAAHDRACNGALAEAIVEALAPPRINPQVRSVKSNGDDD